MKNIIEDPSIREKRQAAGFLLDAVWQEDILPKQAIARWPETRDASIRALADPSLDCAYKALWHFEADEKAQQEEVFYMDAQLELLKQMAAFLKKGDPLPQYILSEYDTQIPPIRFYDARTFFVQVWQDSVKRICYVWRLASAILKNLDAGLRRNDK